MLIYTPNSIPKSFKEKLATYIPSVRFRHIDMPFPLFTNVPFVDARYSPPQVGYHRVYTKKCLLSITYEYRHEKRERRSSDYEGDYDYTVEFDGVHLLLYLGSEERLVRKTAFSDREDYGINGVYGKWRSGYGKAGEPRTDLYDPLVQDFIMKMLEEHFQNLLQTSL